MSVPAMADLSTAIPSNHVKPDNSINAALYLQQNGAQLHPALEVALQQGTKGSEPPFRSELTATYTEEFKLLIQKYQNSDWDPKTHVLAGRTELSWEDVVTKAREAEENHVAADSGKLGKIRRKVTDNAARALPFVRMIPNDTFCAAISGGVRLVVEAAARISEAEEQALRALLHIPFVIVQADECCEIFGRDPELLACAEEFYVAALAAIEGTVKWLHTSDTGATKKALLKGPLYNKSFDEKLYILGQKSEMLESRISVLSHRRQQRIETGQKRLEATVQEIKSGYTHASAKIDQIHAEQRHHQVQEEQKRQASKSAIEQMIEVLKDTNATAQWMQQKDKDVRILKQTIKEMQKAANALTKEDIVRILDVRRDQAKNDLDKVIRSEQDPSETQLALRVVNNETFKGWQSADESCLLFVETQMPSLLGRYVTGVTLACSYFIKYPPEPETNVIYHFCGHHTRIDDPLSGPIGPIRNLLSQFLRCYSKHQFNLDFISRRLKQKIEDSDLRGLCDCFMELMHQLPLTENLFCVIDSVHILERGQTESIEDAGYLVDALQELVLVDDDLKAPVHLLFTSPVRTLKIQKLFRSDCILRIRNEGSGSRGQMTER